MKQTYHSELNYLRQQLGMESQNFISDDRISIMLHMTQGDTDQAALMALGYIVHMLDMEIKQSSTEDTNTLKQKRKHYQVMIDERMSKNSLIN